MGFPRILRTQRKLNNTKYSLTLLPGRSEEQVRKGEKEKREREDGDWERRREGEKDEEREENYLQSPIPLILSGMPEQS